MHHLKEIYIQAMISTIILTCSSQGSASVQLAELLKSDQIEVKCVVLSQGIIPNKAKYFRRKITKTIKVGLFGVLNGIRMRKWYTVETARHIDCRSVKDICSEQSIPLFLTPSINCSQTRSLFQKAKADIGLSLGNGYISSSVFSIPKFGMINIHHEVLPFYQNAASIIWQLYNNSTTTGYTIHLIDKKIDAGDILYKEVIPITFMTNLKTTVSYNYARLWEKSAEGLVVLLENYEVFYNDRIAQGPGKSYTTPSLKEYLIICKNHRQLKREHNL